MNKDFLKNIITYKEELNGIKQAFYKQIKAKLGISEYTCYSLFKKRISVAGQINLIAEIKKASPSKGLIREEFDLLGVAKIYAQHKAAAISVLTEDKYFLGNPLYIKKVSEECNVPILTKDFIIDEGQIYEAQLNGASAVLLIVAILDDGTLKKFLNVAKNLGLDCLVEVHDRDELKRAVDCGAEIIGVNNRNLQTFEVDLKTSEKLIPQIPDGIVKVAESGIQTCEDVQRLKDCGANAVLIGETFMREEDVGAKIRELFDRGDPETL